MAKGTERDEQAPVEDTQEVVKDTPDKEPTTAPELPEEDAVTIDDVAPDASDDSTPAEPQAKQSEPPQRWPRPTEAPAAKQSAFKRFGHWVATHKKLSIPLVVMLLLGVLAAIPATRYALAGTVLKQDFTLKVVDADTKKPVSSAKVSLGGKNVTTDAKGVATFNVAVGSKTATVSKKYFKDSELAVTVPILKQKDVPTIALKATGRQVPLVVINKITQRPLANVMIKSGEAEAKTDKAGKAVLVIPAGQQALDVTFSADGYNELRQSLKVTGENTAALVPEGKLFFLSNQSGTLDVVSTNLDGSSRQVIVTGTGKEDRNNTLLYPSRDSKYLALIARRDSEKPKVYLIDTAKSQLVTMDEGDAGFQAIGWSGHRFVYKVERNSKKYWEAGKFALKSFDAPSKKLATLDETKGEGTQNDYKNESMDWVTIVDDEVVFVKNWSGGWTSGYAGKQNAVYSVQPDGKAKRTVKAYEVTEGGNYASLEIRTYTSRSMYILRNVSDKGVVEEYKNGQVKPVSMSRDDFYNRPALAYHPSIDGSRTFWHDDRDGSKVLFVGNENGEDKKEIASLDGEYAAYGWFNDQYLLVSYKSKTLYILPVGGVKSAAQLVKVTDYYPVPTYGGHGY